MGFSNFAVTELAEAIESHFKAMESEVCGSYSELAHEDNLSGAIQILLMSRTALHKLIDDFESAGYELEVEFVAKRDRQEPDTGVDLVVQLRINTHPMQSVRGFKNIGFFSRNEVRKTLLVQNKNLSTKYGVNVRCDQLAKIAERTVNGGVVWFLSGKGVEVSPANDLHEHRISHYADVPEPLKFGFSEFMSAFFETNVGDHDPRLFTAAEAGNLSDFIRYTIRPTGYER